MHPCDGQIGPLERMKRPQLSHEADMKRTFAILVLACVSLTGCRSGGRKELLTRDLRLQEDRIYELEDMLDQMECQLESCRRENETLKKEQGGGGTSGLAARRVLSRRRSSICLRGSPDLANPCRAGPAHERATSSRQRGWSRRRSSWDRASKELLSWSACRPVVLRGWTAASYRTRSQSRS